MTCERIDGRVPDTRRRGCEEGNKNEETRCLQVLVDSLRGMELQIGLSGHLCGMDAVCSASAH